MWPFIAQQIEGCWLGHTKKNVTETSGPIVTETSGPIVTETSGPIVTETSGPIVTETSGPMSQVLVLL